MGECLGSYSEELLCSQVKLLLVCLSVLWIIDPLKCVEIFVYKSVFSPWWCVFWLGLFFSLSMLATVGLVTLLQHMENRGLA